MRIACEGWHRNHGERTLFTGQLSDAQVSVGPAGIEYNAIRLVIPDQPPDRRQNLPVRVQFRIDTRSAPLNGEYLLSITFSRSDILRLFRGAFDNTTVSKLITLLAEAELDAG